MAGSFIDLLGGGLGRVGRAADITSGPAQDPLDALLQRVLAPVALGRGVFQAADYAAKTGAGIITPSELSGAPDDPFTFLRAAQERGLPQAATEAQHRFEAAPQAFEGQKGIVEFGLNPLNAVGAGLPGAALKLGGGAVARTPGIGRALTAAAAADAAVTQAIGEVVGGSLGAVGGALASTPILGRPLQASAQAGVSKASDVLANLQAGLRTSAKSLGFEVPEGGVTRAVFDPDLRAAQAAEALGASPQVAKNWTNYINQDIDMVRNSMARHAGMPAAKQGQPFDLAAAQAKLDAFAPADPAIVDAAVTAARQERSGETGSNMLKAIDKALEERATRTGQVLETDERLSGRWSNFTRWLQDIYGPTLPGTAEGGIAARAARAGTPPRPAPAPAPPAGGVPSPAPPAAGAAPAAPAEGIPLGRARIDPTKLQEGLDMGLTRDQAMDRARVGIDLGEAAPPLGAAPVPSGATPRAAPPLADLSERILAEEPAEAMRVLLQNRAAQGPAPTVPPGPPTPPARPAVPDLSQIPVFVRDYTPSERITFKHLMNDLPMDHPQRGPGLEALNQGVRERLAREQGLLPPLGPEAAPPPPEGIPFGSAQIDRGKFQEGLDMGLTRDQAMDRARVGFRAGGEAPPGAPGAPMPPGAAAPGGAPVAAGGAENLGEMFGSLGRAMSGQLVDDLWRATQAGETVLKGQPNAILQAAKLLRDEGRLQTRADVEQLARQVSPLDRTGPTFQQDMQRIVREFQPGAAPGSAPIPPERPPPMQFDAEGNVVAVEGRPPVVPPAAAPQPWRPPAPGNAQERGFTSLYSEMAPDEAALLINDVGGLAGHWVSPSADLALGQGMNRGALVEFAPETLSRIALDRPLPGQQKPGVAMMEATGQGLQEWVIGADARSLAGDNVIRTITLKPGVAPGRYGRRLDLWPSDTLPDGSIRYTNPRFAPEPPAPPPAGGALPLEGGPPAPARPADWPSATPPPAPGSPEYLAALQAQQAAPAPAPGLGAAPEAALPLEGVPPAGVPPAGAPPAPGAPPPPTGPGPLDDVALLAVTPGGKAARELRQVLPGVIQGLDQDRKSVQTALDALGLSGQTLPDAAKAAEGLRIAGVRPAEATTLIQANHKYGGLDIFAPGSDDAAILAGYVRQVAQGRGLGDISKLGKVYQEVLTGWRQQALFAPAYHINNILDALMKNALYLGGSNQFTDLGPNLANAFRLAFTGKSTGYGPTTKAWLEARGITLPQEVVQGGLSVELTGGLGREARGLERLPGVGKLFVLNREFAHAIETSARTAAFQHGFDSILAKASPELATLAKMPLAQAKAQATPEAFAALGKLRNDAYEAGIALSDKLHFNYRDTSNLDEALRQFAGFHMFATRNIPLYAEILATHPGLYNSMRKYDEFSKEQQKAAGQEKGKRFEGTVPLGSVGQTIANTLFSPGGGQIFFNPQRYLSITGQLFGTPPNPAKGESGFGLFLDQMSQLGIGPNPLVQAGLQVSGLLGARQPSALLRVEPLVKAALEVANPAGGVPQTLWDQLQRQRPFGGPPPADANGAVLRRLSQMALEQTGDPNHPAYVAAAREGGRNVLWQQAVYDLGMQGLVERPLSLAGLPVVTQRGGEAGINAAQAGAPEVTATGGNRPLDPIIPFEGVAPGTPVTTYRMRDAEMARRAAAGQPAALGYRDFGPPPAARGTSATAQRRAAVIAEYQTASPARRQAILADPVDGRFVWEHLLQQSPLMHQGRR